jgi:hypothetical protein
MMNRFIGILARPLLQPLVEASGAAHGDVVAGGQFCSPSDPVRPMLAVLEAASLR